MDFLTGVLVGLNQVSDLLFLQLKLKVLVALHWIRLLHYVAEIQIKLVVVSVYVV